ncbi:MAG: prephenate dehydratase domain-containing protein [Flavobacteriales bacterium]
MMAKNNSIIGTILSNYALLFKHALKILGEVYISIQHQLMTLPKQNLEDLEVISHPIALLQCEVFFNIYPGIKISDYPDTAKAAQCIYDNRIAQLAVIAPKNTAEVYGLHILARDIQTIQNNFTYFFILNIYNQGYPQTVFDKASISCRLPHTTGSLSKVLCVIAELIINKIQSIYII